MFCSYCGKKMADGAQFCSGCGARVKASEQAAQSNDSTVGQPYSNQGFGGGQQTKTTDRWGQGTPSHNGDRPSLGWAIFAFIFNGFISIILYFVWRHDRPLRAKSILKGWLCGLVFWIVVMVIMYSTGLMDDFDF